MNKTNALTFASNHGDPNQAPPSPEISPINPLRPEIPSTPKKPPEFIAPDFKPEITPSSAEPEIIKIVDY